MTLEEKLRLYADRVHLQPEDVDYLLGVTRESVAAERARCAQVAIDARSRWPENPHVRAVLRSLACEIMEEP